MHMDLSAFIYFSSVFITMFSFVVCIIIQKNCPSLDFRCKSKYIIKLTVETLTCWMCSNLKIKKTRATSPDFILVLHSTTLKIFMISVYSHQRCIQSEDWHQRTRNIFLKNARIIIPRQFRRAEWATGLHHLQAALRLRLHQGKFFRQGWGQFALWMNFKYIEEQ